MTFKIIVQGKVQGLGFRASTKEVADGLGIRGTVENLKNGDVVILAQGNEEQLSKFIEWCHSGPAKANVENLIKTEIDDSDFLKNFIIKRW